MVVIDDREFSFQWLHELIAPLVGILVAGKIVGDDEEHSATALARVLNTVQLLVGSDQASAIYRRQSGLFPVKKFWVRSVSVSEVLDWMELHGLETLIEATGAHDASPVKLTPVSAIESSESTVTLCDEQPEERTAELPTIVITAADDSGSLQAIAEPVVDEQTTATTTREMDAALDGWFDAFDSVALVVALGRIGGAGGAVDEEKLVQRLLFGSIVRGGGAVARTAKVMVEILKSRECGLSFGGVMSSFKVFVDKIDETAQNYPATFKYFGIVYGMLLVEFEYEFSLAALAKLLRNTIVEDEASMSALKILRQVLGVAQSILGDGGLLALYVRQGVTLETFWAPRDRSLENVKDFLEASSLEFLVGITFSH
ncbi:hypothetical protein HDU84_007010 [Entophlyctis sp. JEL0112]|nr:hypothetical protein HDU84_007010 [Entophlyctis sp. JEL0112]